MCNKEKDCCSCVNADSGVCDYAGEVGCGYVCDKYRMNTEQFVDKCIELANEEAL